MSLWVDKYRPTSLDTLDYHPEITARLQEMTLNGDFPHLLIYGPSGAGKKTRISAILREIYGIRSEKLKIEVRQFETPSKKKLEINLISSNYHVEITPSDLGNSDQLVIQDLIKEMAQTKQIDSNAKHRFKIVVINEADSLSRNAQAALRRTMEKYMANLRVILCCNVTSKIIAPIRSRCMMLRIPCPSDETVVNVLESCAKSEKINLPPQLAKRIAQSCEGNLRKALLMFESLYVQQYPFVDSQQLPVTDWELFIQEIANTIINDQTPQTLAEVRSKFYQLLANCIPPETIIKTLTFELLNIVDGQLKLDVITNAAEYVNPANTRNIACGWETRQFFI
ncbi:Subunit of heteropentameric Replication factor C (RF-C) [Terramyces sp. JEL0728]|nr:Subunit of heteropentameric Replication factor C (RF-C) [Terramyces sp. JEL0728]